MAFTINPPNAPLVKPDGTIEPTWYRFFANLQRILGNDILTEIQQSKILTYGNSPVLTDERTLQGGTGMTLAIGPAFATLDLDDTPVSPGTYGGATMTVAFSVDQQGRITSAVQIALVTDNIAEGGSKLFFTTARARASLSGGTGITYNSTSGVIAIDGTVATLTDAQTLTNKTLSSPLFNGYRAATRTITVTGSATSADSLILADATAGAITVNLPPVATNDGVVLSIKKIDASVNAVTLDGNASETIDGSATRTITTQYDSLTIQCNGAAWWRI